MAGYRMIRVLDQKKGKAGQGGSGLFRGKRHRLGD